MAGNVPRGVIGGGSGGRNIIDNKVFFARFYLAFEVVDGVKTVFCRFSGVAGGGGLYYSVVDLIENRDNLRLGEPSFFMVFGMDP
jgi:hypothetical protein